MKRRELLSVGLMAGVALSETARAATAPVSSQEHGKMTRSVRSYEALMAASAACEARGEECLEHCLEMTASGRMSMLPCIEKVRQMLTGCEAIRALALQKSSFVPRMAAVVRDLCTACEQECDKHAATHEVCRECRDAAARCASECQNLAA